MTVQNIQTHHQNPAKSLFENLPKSLFKHSYIQNHRFKYSYIQNHYSNIHTFKTTKFKPKFTIDQSKNQTHKNSNLHPASPAQPPPSLAQPPSLPLALSPHPPSPAPPPPTPNAPTTKQDTRIRV
ncbi:hypothetical protein Hanom_Chr03g00258351 [Helianthus anomalus]